MPREQENPFPRCQSPHTPSGSSASVYAFFICRLLPCLKRTMPPTCQVPCPWCSLFCLNSSSLLSHQLSPFPLGISSHMSAKVVTVCLPDSKVKQNYKPANRRCPTVSFAPFSQLPLEAWSPLVLLPCVSFSLPVSTQSFYILTTSTFVLFRDLCFYY